MLSNMIFSIGVEDCVSPVMGMLLLSSFMQKTFRNSVCFLDFSSSRAVNITLQEYVCNAFNISKEKVAAFENFFCCCKCC